MSKLYEPRLRTLRIQGLLLGCLLTILSGCATGAVQFAPTPLPPDLSPIRYEHPGGAFSISVPRNWSVYEQNTATLASTSFSIPEFTTPSLTIAVINIGDPIEVQDMVTLIDDYQTVHRPDLSRYREQERTSLGDGSWQISGVRTVTGSTIQQINTFIQAEGTFLSVIEVIIPNSAATLSSLQTAVNTLSLDPEAPLQPTGLSTFSFIRTAQLEILNVGTWTNESGVFFVTGEVANYSEITVDNVPVRVSILDSAGNILIEAADVSMGYGIPSGGFAPFSLRFGQGQPPEAEQYLIRTENSELVESDRNIVSGNMLAWEESSSFTDTGDLRITGTVTNQGNAPVTDLLALITVFDANQNVIGAWFSPVGDDSLAPDESIPFEVLVLEVGGNPLNYIVEIQGIGAQ